MVNPNMHRGYHIQIIHFYIFLHVKSIIPIYKTVTIRTYYFSSRYTGILSLRSSHPDLMRVYFILHPLITLNMSYSPTPSINKVIMSV